MKDNLCMFLNIVIRIILKDRIISTYKLYNYKLYNYKLYKLKNKNLYSRKIFFFLTKFVLYFYLYINLIFFEINTFFYKLC